MDYTQLEKCRKLVVRSSELVNLIDGAQAENESIQTKIDVISKMENKSHDDLRFINMAPERIKRNEHLIDIASKDLLDIFGIVLE